MQSEEHTSRKRAELERYGAVLYVSRSAATRFLPTTTTGGVAGIILGVAVFVFFVITVFFDSSTDRGQAGSRKREPSPPHTVHEDSDRDDDRHRPDTGSADDADLPILLDDSGSSTSRTFRDGAPCTEPRRRRLWVEPDKSSQSTVIDGPSADIPNETEIPASVDLPAPEPHNPWNAAVPPAPASRPASPPSPNSPFSLGLSATTSLQPLPLVQQSSPPDSPAYPIHRMTSSSTLRPSQPLEVPTVVAPSIPSTRTSSESSFYTAKELRSPGSTQSNSPSQTPWHSAMTSPSTQTLPSLEPAVTNSEPDRLDDLRQLQ
ncbi:hypothetical protein DFH11DRAFT_1883731 [Phellopilus nigrolimitatus]|nr:hypothetical protein DFH11DRAFT_1883731 [Phellopilus nigrolimitatus]